MAERFLLSRSHQDFQGVSHRPRRRCADPARCELRSRLERIAGRRFRSPRVVQPDRDGIIRCSGTRFRGSPRSAQRCTGRSMRDKAEASSPRYCFPARIEEMIVLEERDRAQSRPEPGRTTIWGISITTSDVTMKRFAAGAARWNWMPRSPFPGGTWALRSSMCCTIRRPPTECMKRAFAANPEDARLLYEWDQLKKRAGLASPQDRLRIARSASRTRCPPGRSDGRVCHSAESVGQISRGAFHPEETALQSLGRRRRTCIGTVCIRSSCARH